jgi:hypothetical protein
MRYTTLGFLQSTPRKKQVKNTEKYRISDEYLQAYRHLVALTLHPHGSQIGEHMNLQTAVTSVLMLKIEQKR